MRLGLLAALLRSRLFLAGIVCDGLAYALQFLALGHGTLVVVQPLLVCGLLFALPLGARFEGARMTNRDWWGAAAIVVGLSVFLLVSSPAKGHSEVTNPDWIGLLSVAAVVIAALILLARGRSSRVRAGLLAAGAAINYGVTAALTKAVAGLLSNGVVEVLESWELYLLVGAGVLGMLLAQSAFQAGPLEASLPVLTVVDPIVSIIIGATVLGETIQSGLLSTTVEIGGLILLTVGVVALSHSEAVKIGVEETVVAATDLSAGS